MKKILLLVLSTMCFVLSEAQTNDQELAIQLVKKNSAAIGLTAQDIENSRVSDTYFDKTGGIRLVYLQQSYKGIQVFNQILVLAFKNDQLVSKAGKRIASIEKKTNGNSGIPAINAEVAVNAAIADRKLSASKPALVVASEMNGHKLIFDDMGVSRENISAELMWVPLKDGEELVLAWQVYIIQNTSSDYWLVRINANDKSTVGVSNLTVYCNFDDPNKNHAHTPGSEINHELPKVEAPRLFNVPEGNSPNIVNGASYRVIPFPAESPIHPGGAHALRNNPWLLAPGDATTLKWHNNGLVDFNFTRGNNVWSQEDRNGNNGTGIPATSPIGPDPLAFDFVPNFTVAPIQTVPNPNQQFSTTNLFYWNNIIHDLSYVYGFDEVSGNFQTSNMGRGGQENDLVFADAQDGGGTNNANFSTPSDGGSGRMQMYLWSGNPQKDGSLDNGIVAHEFGHGISNRLTGGPANAACLGNEEQMGEGWSDYFCLMYTQDWASSNLNTGFSSPRGIGAYAAGQTATGGGIRSQKYSTNFNVNNKVYAPTISGQQHNRGEIWCAVLWDMTWNIINQVGTINPNIYDAASTAGNVVALKLVMEGMKLQPCSPGFIDGRDAILQADQILYNGAHVCAIKEAFRRRGMGAFANQGSSSSVTDQASDYTLAGANIVLTQNVTEVPEGQNITYTNTVIADVCAGVSNFRITDTLPSNVTYVSGGTYDAANRVVSFDVTQAAGVTQQYVFTVRVNTGAYYPTVNLFEDQVTSATIPTQWTASSSTTNNWAVSTARSFSPDKSYFSSNLDVTSDQLLTLSNSIALGANPPFLTFRSWYNTESKYDGGVLEISTNNGTTWTDMGTNILVGGYDIVMDPTTLLTGRLAWSGNTNNKFRKTKVNLLPYANQNVKIRFRFASDVGTNLEGWYLDDIAIKNQAVVEMQSNLFNATNVRISVADTVTVILPGATCTAATVTTQPANITACAGGNATFTAVVTGTSPVYQWQVSTNGGSTYSNIAGATNATLIINNVTAAQNNYLYQLVISNSCPSNATSTAATLTVTEPAAITLQPAPQSLCSGGNASFSVTASGNSNTYQWQVSTDNGATFTDIAGATSATLNLSNVNANLNGNLYHVVIGSCGPNGLTSTNVLLTVNSVASIASQPSNVTTCAGGTASFTATVTGTTLTYQWQVSTDGGATFTNISGATGATLDLTNVQVSQNNNQYQVVVTSTACPTTVTSTAGILSVTNTASISAQPSATSACVGTNALFSVAANGAGLTYQWQVSTNGGTTYTDIAGETGTSLNISNITAGLQGNFYRVVVNSTCSANALISDAVQLTVLLLQFNSQPTSVNICGNSNANFSITATGNTLSYQWQVSTDGGTTYNDIAGETNASLSLTAVPTSFNNNRYRCMVSGIPCGTITSDPALLTVSTGAQVTAQPVNATACSGADATLTVTATGTILTYQWQVSTDGGTTFTNITGATNNSLVLSGVTSSMNNNQYQVVVTEANCGSVTSNAAALVINPTPSITISANPGTTLASGQSTTLTATATPTATTFAWFNNGNVVPGQTGSSIVVNFDAVGSYTAAATVDGCSGISAPLLINDTIFRYTFIYPNPNTGNFIVRYEGVPGNNKPRWITLYDAKGSRVFVKGYTVTSSYEPMVVNVPKLSDGVYMLVLSDSGGSILKTGKVVISR